MRRFSDPAGCLDHALGLLDRPGLLLEFGVADGHSLRRVVAGAPAGSRVVGFDSFDGLPEHWRDGFGQGMFRTNRPEVPGAELVVGLYTATLPTWSSNDEPIRLVHIDCDLYSSTRTVLEHIGPHLTPGGLVVFDEFHGYSGHEAHEAKAWAEWAEENDIRWTVLAEGPEQLLIRLED